MTGVVGVALVTLAVASPWIVRNYVVFGKLIPSSTMGGAVLFGSYNERILNEPELHGAWVSPCEVPGANWSCKLDELGRDAAWNELGLAFIRSHLADLPRMAWWRFIDFWHLYPFTRGFPANVGFIYYVIVALLALAGLWLMRRRWRATGLLLVVILCFMVNALIFWGGFRMRTPVEPALIILAAASLNLGVFRPPFAYSDMPLSPEQRIALRRRFYPDADARTFGIVENRARPTLAAWGCCARRGHRHWHMDPAAIHKADRPVGRRGSRVAGFGRRTGRPAQAGAGRSRRAALR